MTTIELHINAQTLARARAIAVERNQTLEQVVAQLIEELGQSAAPVAPGDSRSVIGMFSDVPDVLDEIVDEALASRTLRWQRDDGG